MSPLPPYRGAPSPADVADREAFDALVDSSLVDTRASAATWRNGLAALVTLATGALVLKGPEAAAELDWPARLGLTVVLGGGLACAVVGLWNALSAEAGVPQRVTHQWVLDHHGSTREFTVATAMVAVVRLRTARRLVLVSLTLFLAGTILWWWLPVASAEPVVTVTTTAGVSACGTLSSADGGAVRIVVAGASAPTTVPLAEVANLVLGASCDAPAGPVDKSEPGRGPFLGSPHGIGEGAAMRFEVEVAAVAADATGAGTRGPCSVTCRWPRTCSCSPGVPRGPGRRGGPRPGPRVGAAARRGPGAGLGPRRGPDRGGPGLCRGRGRRR